VRALKATLIASFITALAGLLAWKVPFFGALAIILASSTISWAPGMLGHDTNGFFSPNAAGIAVLLTVFFTLTFFLTYALLEDIRRR
jgi:ABC-type xylose transport system permease subunit